MYSHYCVSCIRAIVYIPYYMHGFTLICYSSRYFKKLSLHGFIIRLSYKCTGISELLLILDTYIAIMITSLTFSYKLKYLHLYYLCSIACPKREYP